MKQNFFIKFITILVAFSFVAESMLFPFSVRAVDTPDQDALNAALNYDIEGRMNSIRENDAEIAQMAHEIATNPAIACNAKTLGDLASVLGSTAASAGYQASVDWLARQGGNWTKMGNLLGAGEVPTSDAKAIAGQLFDRVKKCVSALRENAFKIAFNDFKKRLLDSMVDDTLQWIKNGFNGEPGFYQDFGKTLKNAANAAAGDVAKDIGLASFCTPFQQQFAESISISSNPLIVPTFSEQVSCTLTDIVGNVGAFANDFSQGGWKGYLELAKPQNNRFGQMMLVLDEVNRRKAEAERAQEIEFIAYQGYKPTKVCMEWDIFSQANGQRIAGSIPTYEKEILYNDPALYDPRCVKEDITTPGSSVRSIADAALTADFRYAVNADDLSPYFGAILDTAFRRLIDSGAKGLFGIEPSRSSQGKKPETFVERAQVIKDSPDLTDEEKAAQLQPIQHLAGAGATSSRAADTTAQLASASQKTAEDLGIQLSEILSLISRAETLRDQILLTIRGKRANPEPATELAEKTFFESFVGPGFVDEATKGLSRCQSDTLNASNCTVAQIQHTGDLAEAIAGVGESFPEDEQQIENLITEINGVAAISEGASEDVLLGLDARLSAIANQESEMRARYNQTILSLMETLDGSQSIVGLKAELLSCVTYVVEKTRNRNPDVYVCPQLPR